MMLWWFLAPNFAVVCTTKWLRNAVDFKTPRETKVRCKFPLIIMVKLLSGYFDKLKVIVVFSIGGDAQD